LSVMLEDIRLAKALGADGVVIGCLTAAGDVDTGKTSALIAAARPLNITFHRAFDMCRDARQALETLVQLGVQRVLTSGQEASVLEGLEVVKQLQAQAAGRIIIMPGGGVTPRNVRRIIEASCVSEVHLSARSSVESGMQHRNTRCFMGGVLRPPEFSLKTTDENAVRSVVTAVNQ
jgi:copper homeostasis protein